MSLLIFKETCPVCHNDFSKYGLFRHIKKEHPDYSILDKKHDSMTRRSRRITNRTFFSDDLIEEFVRKNNEGTTLIEFCENNSLGYYSAQEMLRKKGVKIRNWSIATIKNKLDKELKEFGSSEKGQKIIQEYQIYGGTIKGLCKKYGVYVDTLKRILILQNVPLKSNVQARREQASLCKGPKHPNYGRKVTVGSGKCSWYLYEGVKYQGSWEFKYGLWLKSQNILFKCHEGVRSFEYEVDGNKKTYCPDFFIDSNNTFIEIKGYFSKQDQLKIALVRQTYPDINIEVFKKEDFIQKDILNIDKKLGIEIGNYLLNYKTGNLYFKELCQSVGEERIIEDWVLYGLSWSKIAKKYDVPVRVISGIFNRIAPKRGTPEYYIFIGNKFLDIQKIKDLLKERVACKKIAREITKFKYKTSYAIVNTIRKKSLCP